MSIVLGIIIPAILYLITLPLQAFLFVLRQNLKAMEVALKAGDKFSSKASKLKNKLGVSDGEDALRARLGLAPKNKNVQKIKQKTGKVLTKMGITSLKAMQRLIKAISRLIKFLRELASTSLVTAIIAIVLVVVIFVSLIISTSGIILFSKKNVEDNSSNTTVSVSTASSSSSSQSSGTVSKNVQDIVNMSEKDVWNLISEGKYSSYKEADADAHKDWGGCKKFWTSMQTTIKVKVWVWDGSGYKNKKEKELSLQINKHLAEFWKSFFDDLHNCPDKYVVEELGGFSFRNKNNNSSKKSLSSHSFGTAIDINWSTDGMGSVVSSVDHHPWNSDKGLSEPYKSQACAFNSNWFSLIKKYGLDWGGNWKSGSLDPMHFSVVGDTPKDGRNFSPQTAGQKPK